MLDSSNSDPTDDGKTKEAFIKGKSLFYWDHRMELWTQKIQWTNLV